MTQSTTPTAWSGRMLFSTTLFVQPDRRFLVTVIERSQELDHTFLSLAITDGSHGTVTRAVFGPSSPSWRCDAQPIIATWPGDYGGSQVVVAIEALLQRFGAPGGEEVIMHTQRRAFQRPAIELLLEVVDQLVADGGDRVDAVLGDYGSAIASVRSTIELGRGVDDDVRTTLRGLRDGLREVQPLTLPEMVGIHDRVRMAHYAPTAMLPRALVTLLEEMLAEDQAAEAGPDADAPPSDPRELPVTAVARAQLMERAEAMVLRALEHRGWRKRGPTLPADERTVVVRLQYSGLGPMPMPTQHPLTGATLQVQVVPVRIGAKTIDTPCVDVEVTDEMLKEHGQ